MPKDEWKRANDRTKYGHIGDTEKIEKQAETEVSLDKKADWWIRKLSAKPRKNRKPRTRRNKPAAD